MPKMKINMRIKTSNTSYDNITADQYQIIVVDISRFTYIELWTGNIAVWKRISTIPLLPKEITMFLAKMIIK